MQYGNYRSTRKSGISRYEVRIRIAQRTVQELSKMTRSMSQTLVGSVIQDNGKGTIYGRREGKYN